MYFEFFIAAALLCAGGIVFGRFAAEVPRWHRILKVAVFVGLTAAISALGGRRAALAWIFGATTLAMGVHGWWTRSHGIGFWTPEPWDRYRALRGWEGGRPC
jgi:hypothetical protein